MKPILNDPKIAPVEAVLQNAMGDNFINYTSLLEIVSKHGLTPEWHYYHDGKSWLCKMMYKKKNAFWFSVWADCFKTSFYFTEKDVEKIVALPISETIKSEFIMQKTIGKLIPMIISIKDSEPLKDIDVMIRYKISKK